MSIKIFNAYYHHGIERYLLSIKRTFFLNSFYLMFPKLTLHGRYAMTFFALAWTVFIKHKYQSIKCQNCNCICSSEYEQRSACYIRLTFHHYLQKTCLKYCFHKLKYNDVHCFDFPLI